MLFVTQMYINLRVSWCCYALRKYLTNGAHLMKGLLVFFYLEIFAFTGYILCYTLFLLLRSCFKHQRLAEALTPEYMHLPLLDTVLSLRVELNTFNNGVLPFLMNIFIFMLPNAKATSGVLYSILFPAQLFAICANFVFSLL